MKRSLFILFVLLPLVQFAQDLRIEPPFWWIDMECSEVQLLLYQENIGQSYDLKCDTEGVNVISVEHVPNDNYLFVNIRINADAESGTYSFSYNSKSGKTSFRYSIKKRSQENDRHQGFNASDVMYLLMPDRFANSNPQNDMIPGFLDSKIDRNDSLARHGGDIQGVIDHLDYIADLGVTSIWLNPVLENNVGIWSYHGYAITDFYKVDARLGTNEDYKRLVKESHSRGLKVIKDMVSNHCGDNHWIVKDPPMEDWLHVYDSFTRTNYRGVTNVDPYASKADHELMEKGSFDVMMPDLNQDNPYVSKYLIQNSIWWIEYAGLDGIRMDTYSYPNKDFLAKWARSVKAEYPNFNIVAEVWENKSTTQAYWQSGANGPDEYDSEVTAVTDFVWKFALDKALNEPSGWETGLSRMYYTLTEDRIYSDPNELVIFIDNHDLVRIKTVMNNDISKVKMAIAMLLTTRGAVQWYYGTELGMTGVTHGDVRSDYPGGWEEDQTNVLSGDFLDQDHEEIYKYSKKLLNWRKENPDLMRGKLMHFIPQEGVYVYFRYTDDQKVMVICNENNKPMDIDVSRFEEILSSDTGGIDIMSDEKLIELSDLRVEAKSVRILAIE